MKYRLLLLLLLMVKFANAQTDGNERAPFALKLFVDSTNFYEAPMPKTFFVPKEGVIQIFPGETLYIEADVADNKLINLKAVPSIVNKEKTLTITFEQLHHGKLHEQMMLTISNPFSKGLEYKCIMNLMKQKRWVGTDVIPVRAKIMSKEMWGDILTSVALENFTLKD